MTASELKYRVEQAGHSPYMFSRDAMKFFGDTMSNFGVRSKPVTVETYSGGQYQCWELYRRRPVKHKNQGSFYFEVDTFRRIHGKEI